MKEFKDGSVKFDLHELNDIALLAGEAAKSYENLNLKGLCKWALDFQEQIYDICKKHGLYDDYYNKMK